MILVEHFLFWIPAIAILYTYVFYPTFMRFVANKKVEQTSFCSDSVELPMVSILIAAHNEEKVLEAKQKSLNELSYPKDKIEILIGSDNSTDKTNEILRKWKKNDKRVSVTFFDKRTGKIGIINKLEKEAKGEVLLLTDANVILATDTLDLLVGNFKKSKVGLVDSQMINYNLKRNGISYQEKHYITGEVGLKSAESKLFGSMMGPFGGCFAIKKELFKPVPSSFLVDDFYLNMCVLEQGYQCINEPKAHVYEDVSNDLKAEFKRKIRISTGNFQNLMRFWKLLFRFDGVSFSFFSHKVLRWFGPFLLLIGTYGLFNLIITNLFYYVIAVLGLGIFFLTILDILFFLPNKVHLPIIRYFTHFLAMNFALLIGFFSFLKGVKTSIWEPTARYQ